jgi:hypothetical protein
LQRCPERHDSRRDFFNGIYYEKGCLSTRNTGPHKGKLYHPGTSGIFTAEEHTKEAEKAGEQSKRTGREGLIPCG